MKPEILSIASEPIICARCGTEIGPAPYSCVHVIGDKSYHVGCIATKPDPRDAELHTLKSQRDLLLEVVTVFADAAAQYDGLPDSYTFALLKDDEKLITLGDLRKARDIRNEILNGGDKKDG